MPLRWWGGESFATVLFGELVVLGECVPFERDILGLVMMVFKLIFVV